MITYEWKISHYEIYVNGKFYMSCDNYKELQEDLERIKEELGV